MKPINDFQTSILMGEVNSETLTSEGSKEDLKHFEILAKKVIEKYQSALVSLANGYKK